MTTRALESEEQKKLIASATRMIFVSLMVLMVLTMGASVVAMYINSEYGGDIPYWPLMAMQGMVSIGTFMLAALISVYVSERRVCGSEVSWKVDPIMITYSLFLIIGCQALVAWSSYFNMQLLDIRDLDWLRGYVEETNAANVPLMVKMLSTDSVVQWVTAMLVVAILPAVCEEMFFRGVILRGLKVVTGSNRVAIIASAVFFSMLHLEADAFVPRIVLGVLLGFLYVHTHSLLCPMLAHAANNAMVIVTCGMHEGSINDLLTKEVENPGPLAPILSVVVVIWICGKIRWIESTTMTINK